MAADRQDLLALIYPASRALRRVEDAAAAQHDLTMWQYAILSVVHAAPDLNQRQIAHVLEYSANRIIADIDVLEDRGFVRRVPGSDRRANTVRLTQSGAAVRRRVQRQIHAGEDALLTALTPTERRELSVTLARLNRALRPDG